MKIRILNSMQVPWESWWHLENLSYFQRCGKYHTEEQKERMKRNFEQFAFYDGMKQICDYDQGGAIGDPERSYEEGRWTSWSCFWIDYIVPTGGGRPPEMERAWET